MKPEEPFFKNGTIDYVCDTTIHENSGVSWCKVAWLHMREVVTVMHIATGQPVGLITVVSGSNYAVWWQQHSLYGLDYKNLYLPPFVPRI